MYLENVVRIRIGKQQETADEFLLCITVTIKFTVDALKYALKLRSLPTTISPNILVKILAF